MSEASENRNMHDSTAARRHRLSYTNRCRIALLFTPIILLVVLVAPLPRAIGKAGAAFWWHADFAGAFRYWYRDLYRPAIYGSVHDDA